MADDDLFDSPGGGTADSSGVPRDWQGNPRIVTPETAGTDSPKLVRYLRVTSYIDVLSDKYTLSKYQLRMVLKGLTVLPELAREIHAAIGEDNERELLESIAQRAMTAAGADTKREDGSTLHRLTEKRDAGLPTSIPPEMLADVEAYEALIERHGLELIARELFVVNDERKCAGTLDGIARLGDRYMVMDIKTGNIEADPSKIAAQILAYAEGRVYDPKTGLRSELPVPVDPFFGLLVHLPSLTGTAFLYEVDLSYARLDLVDQISAYRKANKPANVYRAMDNPAGEAGAVANLISGGVAVEELEDPVLKGIAWASTSAQLGEVATYYQQRGEWREEHRAAAIARAATFQ